MDQRWPQEAEAVLTGFKEWRLQHPTATLSEIEAALDARLARLRARLLEDAALASAAADLQALPPAARPRCPEVRHLTTTYEQPLTLRRHYAVRPACDQALSPPG